MPITYTAPAGTVTGSFRSVSIENSSTQNITSSGDSSVFRPHRIEVDSPSQVASDESFEYRQSPEDALVFGRILRIAHVVDGEIYQARVRARRRGEFARDLFFNGRDGEEEDRWSGEDGDDNDGGFVEHFDERDFTSDEVRLGSIGGGYYADESDSEDMSIAQGLECGICMCREVSVQFRECSHALCAPCAKALWKSRVSLFNSCPVSFPCHLCRAEIKEVGKLHTRVPGFGDACRHGERRFTVWKWEGLRRWVSGGKENKKKKSLLSALAGLARRLSRRLANASFTNERDSQGL